MAQDVKQVGADVHDETSRLRTALRDLVAISAVPAAWLGREPQAIAAEFADVLVRSLRLDFVFVRLLSPRDNIAIEVTRGNAWLEFPKWLQRRLTEGGQFLPREIVSDIGRDAHEGRGIVIPIGGNSEGGLVVAARYRAGFPDDIDQLLLSVAANHAATACQNARLIAERRRAEEALQQARDDLETKVAERTAELSRTFKVSQALSGEIVQDKLLDTLMRTAMEQAGADRGLLLLASGEERTIKAQAAINGDRVFVQVRDEPVTTTMLPQSMLHYVLRTRESVILDDAVNEGSFGSDPYIRHRRVRSALCLPLINRGELIGLLYLENNLATHAFTPQRMTVLELLASQAAITLENARLYRDLAEREARIRRLVDANIVGIFIWDLAGGEILEANDAFLRIVGYDREDLVSGRMRWTDLTPPEWLDLDQNQRIPELRRTGTLQPFEKEFTRKDGSRVPVLIGAAMSEEGANQGVSFVLDLTERKRAEAEARESERRYHEVQMELAHSNRATTLGQLTASIAHEVQQPIAATATYASAALRWLDANPANLGEVRQALDGILNESMRAGGIVSGIRDLVRKAPPRKDRVDINEAIREVIELTRGEAANHGVSMKTVLGDGLPLVLGDRVQLQQVMLNLIVNAVEAMSETSMGPRELLISTAGDSSNGASIAVRDSGPGLPAEWIERAFDPFYTTKAHGLGMGLSICRSIVEAHGGRLWASANAPCGAVFQLVLPRGEVEHAPSSENDGLPVA
ncbi:GAF domain-containing protein [Paraburkholderia sp. RL18-103-BIB-C]|uniref:GAF domain-containing sensor histidine kinase n=1 Tax=unclassified Paraburkholderia TaxID=2615204 RepID=UPI0038BD9893